MTDPVETSELLAFTRTVAAQSLSRAALELGVPRATISRRLARLEERLGVRLLRRTTRSLALTDAGEAFHAHARIVLEAVEHAEESVRSEGVVRGNLRVSVPPVLTPEFVQMLVRFAAAYPAVRLQVHASTVHVDLRRDGYDVAIRAGTELEPGLVARTLMRVPLVAVASPSYLARSAPLAHPRDLAKHACLMMYSRGELPQTHWPLRSGGKLLVRGSFASNDILLVRSAAESGLGVALLPLSMVERPVARGRLVRVLDAHVGATSQVAVVYPGREMVPPHVRAFVDHVVAHASRVFELPPCPGEDGGGDEPRGRRRKADEAGTRARRATTGARRR